MPPTPQQPAPVLELDAVTVVSRLDPDVVRARDVNWSVRAGEFWILAGEQNSGKSDLLMLAAGLLPATIGQCRLFGVNAQQLNENRLADRLRTGLVFEDGQLFAHLTVLQNIALPLQYHRGDSAEQVLQTVAPLLERMELTPLAEQRPAEISRNWRKRVGLARALALNPELLLLDNPFHGLTQHHRAWWIHFLDAWRAEHGTTLVLATDDLRPWAQDPHRQFALLHAGRFTAAGAWPDFWHQHQRTIQDLQTGTEPVPA